MRLCYVQYQCSKVNNYHVPQTCIKDKTELRSPWVSSFAAAWEDREKGAASPSHPFTQWPWFQPATESVCVIYSMQFCVITAQPGHRHQDMNFGFLLSKCDELLHPLPCNVQLRLRMAQAAECMFLCKADLPVHRLKLISVGSLVQHHGH